MLRRVLKGETLVPIGDSFEILRSLPHGHVAAVLGTLRRLTLEPILASKKEPLRDRAVAMIVARVIDPQSKLATARGFDDETAFSSLGEVLGVSSASEDDLYEAMDWLLERQPTIERALAKRHLSEGALVLYDLTSTYYEGRTCPLAKRGHNRDGKKGKLQIEFGLVCNADGCPVAVEVFEGNTADPKTLSVQISKIRKRFGLKRVVLVGDRGMLTEARIREDLEPVEGLDWITALRAPAIRKLVQQGDLSPSLFDERDLGEITSSLYPGERLIVCRNPLEATEKELDKITQATKRAKRPLRGKDKIGMRVGKVLNKFKVGKHFQVDITDESFTCSRNNNKILEEAALDGIYVIRTSTRDKTMDAEQTVRAYKGLSRVEQAFRSFKTVDLKVRPIHHRLADRVRAHVLLCMLAYYVEWHMRQALATILFDEDDRLAAEAKRKSPVAPAQRSDRAEHKTQAKRTGDDRPVHSFRTLLQDLATITKNRVRFLGSDATTTEKLTTPTPHQQHILELLKVSLTL
jgi:transposase